MPTGEMTNKAEELGPHVVTYQSAKASMMDHPETVASVGAAVALDECRIAIVHDWLDKIGGAERVLHEILHCFPKSDLYAVVDVLNDEDRDVIFRRPVNTTFVQRLPGARKHFRGYLPLMPLAIEQLDLSRYDVIISSSWAVAKGVITGPDQLHVAYVHTPIRYAWEQQHHYLRDGQMDRGLKGGLARLALHWIRLWDVRTALGVDVWIANSAQVARRIRKTYGQRAQVLHPPIAVDRFPFSRHKQDFYVTCSRLVPYKRVDIIVQAFLAMLGRRLVVIGDGPELPRLKQLARDFAEHSPSRSAKRCRNGGDTDECSGVHLRRGGRFRDCPARGPGLRHAGHRLWKGRSARDHRRTRFS